MSVSDKDLRMLSVHKELVWKTAKYTHILKVSYMTFHFVFQCFVLQNQLQSSTKVVHCSIKSYNKEECGKKLFKNLFFTY